MNHKKIHWIKIFLILQLFSLGGMAGVIRFHQRLQDSVSTTHKDTMTIEVNPKTGSFKDVSVSDILTVGIDPAYANYIRDSAKYTVSLSISGYNAANSLIIITTHTFNITYNPLGKTSLRDQDLYLFNNAYKYKITFTGATKNGTSITSLPDYIYMDADIEVERYYTFASYINSRFTLNANILNIDCDASNIPDELEITWNTGFMSGSNAINPESYDLEWAFINDYDSVPGSYLDSNILAFDFVNNSTRINTANTYYRISLLYEHGFIVYRLRGVGVDTGNINNILYGTWSTANTGTVDTVNHYHNTKPHQTDSMNWQYNASFAEEGKKKEVMAYYDGSLRNRQSVTKMNSDKNTLVGETIYDYQGRPAVHALPVPVDFPATSCDSITQPAIHFFPNFNQDDSTHAYSRNDFDIDSSPGSCSITVAPMDTNSGASHYYSPANPNKTAQQAYVPDAKKYPFTQTEYTPDNTGRIKRQSSVGIDYQLNTGHETLYLYGQPNQTELDRMFGSEVGNASHYKENVVVDANGQSSISYLNMEGKTIATCLAGDSTSNLLKLSSNQPPVTLTVDLFNKNALGISQLDTLNTAGNAIVFNTQLLVAYTSKYSFSYQLSIDTLKDSCLSVCFNCIYDLEMHIYDDCGNDKLAQLLGDTLKKTIGHFTKDADSNLVFHTSCASPTQLTESDTFSLVLEPGNYTVSKSLTIDPQAVTYYVAQYLDSTNNSCFRTLHNFIDSALASVDTSNCHVSCASCVAKLGDRDAFVAAGKGSYLQFDALVAACNEPCQATTLCYASYVQMQADMSPGGQYGDYLTSTDSINPSAFTLSIYNTGNSLPKNLCNSPATWHYPSIILNNTTYPYYVDVNGYRASINIIKISSSGPSVYSPAVVDTSKVYYVDSTSTYYTYPENLNNFSDFLTNWDPNWAQSLVIYHPEYCYYENCLSFSVQYSGNYTTSDAFDGTLQAANTFAKAVSYKFLKYNYHSFSYNNRLVDFSVPSDSLPYDPFIRHGGSFGNTLKSLITSYSTINGDILGMTEMAAYGVRCGNLYGNTSNTGCISFGDSLSSDSILNNEWQAFIGFYSSAKQSLQNQYLDSIVKASGCPGYSGCFGDSNNVFNATAVLGSEHNDLCQPCSDGTSSLYVGKTRRFGSAASYLPSTNLNQVQYQAYLQTGQCPIAFDLQSLLNQIISNGKLKSASNVAMQSYPAFSQDLYLALGGSSTSYTKYYWNSSTSGAVISATFKDSLGNTDCTLSIDFSTAGISSLSGYTIMAASGLSDTTYSSYSNAFRIWFTLNNGTDTIYKKALGYSSCFNITNCKFQQQCAPNDFAGDLQKLMSALANGGKLYSTSVSLDAGYIVYVTPPIKNQLGTTTSNKLIWNYVDVKHYQLYDSLNPSVKLLINVINPTTTISYSSSIASFSGMGSNYYNLFTFNPLNSSNSSLDTWEGEALKQVVISMDTTNYPISMGLCSYAASLFSCQGTQYKLQNQLQLLLYDALVGMPSGHNVDLTKLPDYSYLIMSSLPSGLSATTSTLFTNVAGLDTTYNSELLFTVKSGNDSCPFDLISNKHYGFDSIVDFYNLQGYGNIDTYGNYLQFKGLVQYKRSGVLHTDTIYGQSCLPIQNCCGCGTDTVAIGSSFGSSGQAGSGNYNPADTCLSLYNQYLNAIDSLCHHVINKKKYEFCYNNTLLLTYADVTDGNYCGCLSSYITYINTYDTASNSSPVSLSSYTACPNNTGNTYPSTCTQAYQTDTSTIRLYNSYISTHSISILPSISKTKYSSSSFGTNGFCYCAQAYTAFLQSIIDGVVTPSSVDTNMLNIAKYCQANYVPPCRAYVQPDTGNSVFSTSVANGFPPPSSDSSSCAQYLNNVATQNATNQYNQYIDSLTTSIYNKYVHHCLGASESFTDKYLNKEYHYTLYYYDQAGNLMRTVPPEGIHLVRDSVPPSVPLTSLANAADSICYDRTYNTHNFYTNHTMPSTYVYNSLNQLVKQSLPDHAPLVTWEFALPNGIDSRLKITGVQFVDNNIGYLSGYINLPDTIVPGIYKRGYIYSTSDGGKNWVPIQDVVASYLNKIQMVTKYSGYAVGNQGILLKTIDSGYDWDVVPTYNTYTSIWSSVPDWKDLYFKDSTKGVVVGSNGKSLMIDFTQSPGKQIKPKSLATGVTDNFTGVTYDGSNIYASAVSSGGTYGYMYKSSLDPFATDSLKWDSIFAFKGDQLLAVQFLADSTEGFIGGAGGALLKTSNRGRTWIPISSNLTGSIRNLYFRNDSMGVALVDSVTGYSQLYKTSNGGTTWSLVGSKGVYYTDMAFYKYANTATADKAYVTGPNGSINRLIANTTGTYGTSPYFGIASLNSPNVHKNFTSVAAANYTVSGVQKSKVVMGTSDGKVYYSYNNADSTYIVWDSLTLANVSLNKIGFTYNSSSNLYYIEAIGSNSYLYGSKITSPSSVVTNTITSSSYVGIAITKSGNAYTFDKTNQKVGTLTFSGSSLVETNIGSAYSSIIGGNALACSGNLNLFVAGDSGGVYKDTSITSTPGWRTGNVVAAPLYDMQADGGTSSKAVYAVGKNGTLLQKQPTLNIWKKIKTGRSNNFNALKFYKNTNAVVAADSGKAYTLVIDTTTYSMTGIHKVTPYLTQKFNDISVYSSKEAFAAGNNGTVLYIHDITADTTGQQMNLGAVSYNLNGVQQASSGGVYFAGVSNSIYGALFSYSSSILTTNTILRSTNIFSQAFNKVHFTNPINGYLVGDNGFIRHTTDGITWQVVPPDITRSHLDTINNVFTYQADQATIIGQNAYMANINNTSISSAVSTGLVGNPDLYDISFGSNSPTQGYVVGANKTAFSFTPPSTISSLGTLPTIGSGYDLKALYVFLDNSFMAVGTNGAAAFYNKGSSTWYSHAPPSSAFYSINFNDVCFMDDQNGFVVGNNGVVLRWLTTQNIQKLTASTTTATSNFITKPTKTVLAYGVPDSTQINISSVAFSSANYGFLGGAYPDSINNADYARYVHDESNDFSTSFWYDALGRLVVSQNSKQFAMIPPAYSYTEYDALGRIIEVGQKPENTSAGTNTSRFTNLFSGGSSNGQVNYKSLLTWLKGTRNQVTHTYYDTTAIDTLPFVQQNLRKRVSSVVYCDTVYLADSINLPYNHATHYSYDVHGNVNTLIQDNPSLASLKQRYKRVDYDYDLVSGKVNFVYYQQDSLDQFTHQYTYDADNRITNVSTSHDEVVWDNDASYFYYAHGPLARVEYGNNHVQGIDYYYTLQGWIKGVNSNILSPYNDGGRDGATGGGPNSNFGRDAYGYTLGYYTGDYSPIDTTKWHNIANRFEANTASSSLLAARYDLFNGNIGHMVTSIIQPDTNYASPSILPQGTAYKYDQLNRLVQMKAFTDISSNAFGTTTYNGSYNNRFTYDENGNIITQVRKNQSGTTFDSLTYEYNVQNGSKQQNRLYNVHDTIPASVMSDDIDNQGTFNGSLNFINVKNNYSYDPIGNLVKDSAEGIATINWTVYGKIKSITHRTGYYKLSGMDTVRPPDLVFNYDAAGNRVSKVVKPRTATGVMANTYWQSQYYVRDAQGNVLSVYKQRDSTSISAMYFTQEEKHIYGSSRIGIDETQTQLIGLTASADTSSHYLGNKSYELSNHLGNVLTTVSDRKIPLDTNSDGTIDYYVANLKSVTDVSPFGAPLDGRTFSSGSYRYGFNGKEQDDEVHSSTGTSYDSQELAVKTLEYQHDKGLYTGTTNKDGSISVTQTKITDAQYKNGLNTLKKLNNSGFTGSEQKARDTEAQQEVNRLNSSHKD